MTERSGGMAISSTSLLASLRRKLAIYEKALREIEKSTEWSEGDHTYNQRYEHPTQDSYTARNALREANVGMWVRF